MILATSIKLIHVQSLLHGLFFVFVYNIFFFYLTPLIMSREKIAIKAFLRYLREKVWVQKQRQKKLCGSRRNCQRMFGTKLVQRFQVDTSLEDKSKSARPSVMEDEAIVRKVHPENKSRWSNKLIINSCFNLMHSYILTIVNISLEIGSVGTIHSATQINVHC